MPDLVSDHETYRLQFPVSPDGVQDHRISGNSQDYEDGKNNSKTDAHNHDAAAAVLLFSWAHWWNKGAGPLPDARVLLFQLEFSYPMGRLHRSLVELPLLL